MKSNEPWRVVDPMTGEGVRHIDARRWGSGAPKTGSIFNSVGTPSRRRDTQWVGEGVGDDPTYELFC